MTKCSHNLESNIKVKLNIRLQSKGADRSSDNLMRKKNEIKIQLMQHQVKTVVIQMDVNGRYNLDQVNNRK